MKLAKEISFLLYQHDCVILPGFGAFLKNSKSSEYNEILGYSSPRIEHITFNNQIKNNDGLVANHIAQIRSVSYAEALQEIKTEVDNLWKKLKETKNAELLNVGTFYFTAEEKLIFVPHHANNYCKASFGLPKIKLKKVSIPSDNKPTDKPIKSIPLASDIPLEEETPKLVGKRQENSRRYKELQEKRLQSKLNTEPAKKKRVSGLAILNTVGALFLIAVAAGLFQFEQTMNNRDASNQQIASILDGTFDNAESDTDVLEETPVSLVTQYGIIALTDTEEEAETFTSEMKDKYTSAHISESDPQNVVIITFDNEALADEYRKLLQNKLDQKLVINQI